MINFFQNELESQKPKLKTATYDQIAWVIDLLKGFPDAHWEMVDYSWPKRFDTYLMGFSYSHNSIRQCHRKITQFFKTAVIAGFINSNPYDHFTMGEFNTITVYLSNEELAKIENIQRISRRLDEIRDAFLICAYTAFRISDIKHITQENIIIKKAKGKPGIKLLQVITQKTNTPLMVPMHPKVEAILQKRDMNFSPNLNHCNLYIKKVAKLAGITEGIVISTKNGGTTSIRTVPKYQLIHFHTGRRSAATNMYLAGIDKMAIMKITGHKTESAFMRYICISEEENALKIADNEFFKT